MKKSNKLNKILQCIIAPYKLEFFICIALLIIYLSLCFITLTFPIPTIKDESVIWMGLKIVFVANLIFSIFLYSECDLKENEKLI
jgi:hypothetical protein